MYPEKPRGTRVIVGSMNMGYVSDEHGTCIRHCQCQDSNSQPVQFQVRADSTRPQWRIFGCPESIHLLILNLTLRIWCTLHPTWCASEIQFHPPPPMHEIFLYVCHLRNQFLAHQHSFVRVWETSSLMKYSFHYILILQYSTKSHIIMVNVNVMSM